MKYFVRDALNDEPEDWTEVEANEPDRAAEKHAASTHADKEWPDMHVLEVKYPSGTRVFWDVSVAMEPVFRATKS